MRQQIADAVQAVEITNTEAWSYLDALSSNTHVDSIEIFQDGIRLKDGAFEGSINVHCTLHYGNGDDGFALSESFPGRFSGKVTSNGPEVFELTVDTSGFYA